MKKIGMNKEIDIVGILKEVFSKKKLLAIYVSVFAVVGVIVALNTPKEYTASVVLAPEITGMGMSQSLGDLASMVGVNLGGSGNTTDAIYPDIYPDVFASTDFIIKLFNIKVKTEDGATKTYYDYLLKDTPVPFWKYPVVKLKLLLSKDDNGQNSSKIDPFKLTKVQDGICNRIKKNIACLIDKQTSVITISVTDLNAQISAVMADTIQKMLQDYITEYRTQKARNDLDFAQTAYSEAKVQYEKARQKYSSYMDSDADVILLSLKSKQDEMENEMQLRYNIYNQAVQQLQMAKLKVQERTPAFTIIQKATTPVKASSMPRSVIVILYMFIGGLFDALWVLWGKNYVAKLRNK